MSSDVDLGRNIGRALLALTILISAFGLGGLYTELLCTAALSVVAASVILFWEDGPPALTRESKILITVGIVLCSYTALQLIPMPLSMLARIAPSNAAVWERTFAPFREAAPQYAPITLDPPATRVAILRGLTYLLTFVAALKVSARTGGSMFVLKVLLCSVGAMAVLALVHPALGQNKVFGFYLPETPHSPRHTAPLLNSNHLAGYLNIGACLTLNALLHRRPPAPKPLLSVLLGMMVVTNVYAASRGGIAALIVGLGIVAVLHRGESGRTKGYGGTVLGILALAFIAMLGVASFDQAAHELSDRDLSKFQLFKDTLPLLRSFPIFGVGRGAFESAFGAFRYGQGHVVFTHPENVLLQWTSEWGIPVGALALGAIAWCLRPRETTRSPAASGAFGALAALALQNMVDFSTEVPGVMVAAAACAALLTRKTTLDSSESRFATWAWRGTQATTLAMCVVCFLARHGELFREQRALREQVMQSPKNREAIHASLRGAVRRHPAEAYFSYLGGLRATMAQDESPIPWSSRCLEQSPVYGRAHLLVAWSLRRNNPAQARLEYRLALEQDFGIADAYRKETPVLVATFDDAMELAPKKDPQRSWALEQLALGVAARAPELSDRLYYVLIQENPRNIAALGHLTRASLSDVTKPAPHCVGGERAACVTKAIDLARKLVAVDANHCASHELLARVLLASGDPNKAVDTLDRAIDSIQDRVVCLRALAQLTSDIGDRSRTTATLDKLAEAACSPREVCVENLIFASGMEMGRQNTRHALHYLRRAAELAPERLDLLRQQAELAANLGLHAEAKDIYESLSRREPANPEWPKKAAAETILARSGSLGGSLGRPAHAADGGPQ